MEKLKISSYTINPRSIKNDYLEGKITKPERNLLYWLRACGDAYGTATVNMDGLSQDTFNDSVTKNYINKLLLSLKSKRYIWYSDRSGRRGSFPIRLDDWPKKDGGIQTLDRFFEEDVVRGQNQLESYVIPEVGKEFDDFSQTFDVEKTVITVSESREKIRELIRGLDNDKEKDKNNDKKSLGSLSFKKRDFSVTGFIPESTEEERCLNLATKLGDKGVGFYYGTYKQYGMGPLEKAWEEFKKSDGYNKDNPPAFFNSLVQLEL